MPETLNVYRLKVDNDSAITNESGDEDVLAGRYSVLSVSNESLRSIGNGSLHSIDRTTRVGSRLVRKASGMC